MNAGNSGDLPPAEAATVSKRQLINNVRNEIVPDVESRPASASLAIEDVLRRGRVIRGFYGKGGRSIVYGM
jgi:hypothetical protein